MTGTAWSRLSGPRVPASRSRRSLSGMEKNNRVGKVATDARSRSEVMKDVRQIRVDARKVENDTADT